jgi:sec-independent protein translocase protein TatC
MNFLMTVFVIFGVVFELPVISVLLTTMGIVKVEWMVKSRKVMIVLSFVLSAIITPPDIVSQIMVAIPIIGLYELSILLCRLISKTKKKESAE